MPRNPNSAPRTPNQRPGTPPDIVLGPPIELQNRPEDGPSYALEPTKFKDAEILGKSFRVRRVIDSNVTDSLNGITRRKAEFQNALSTPRNLYLKWRAEAADAKYERKLAKVGTSSFEFRNKHHEKVAAKHKRKRDAKLSKATAHDKHMAARTVSAEKLTTSRDKIHQQKIDRYRSVKIAAEGRKELKRQTRELRDQGMSAQEARARLGLVQRAGETPEAFEQRRRDFQQHIGIQARVIHEADRTRNHAVHRYNRALEKREALHTKRDALTKRIRLTHEQATEMRDTLKTLKIEGKDIHARVTDLTEQLQALSPDDETRAELEQQLHQAREEYEQITIKYEETHQLARRLEINLAKFTKAHQALTRKHSHATQHVLEIRAHVGQQNRHVSDVQRRSHRLQQEYTAAHRVPRSHQTAPRSTPKPHFYHQSRRRAAPQPATTGGN